MRVILTEKATVALEGLQERFRTENADVEPKQGPFLEKLLPCLEQSLTERQIKTLAPKLSSAKLARKRRQEFLTSIADQIDDAALRKLRDCLTESENRTANSQQEIAGKC